MTKNKTGHISLIAVYSSNEAKRYSPSTSESSKEAILSDADRLLNEFLEVYDSQDAARQFYDAAVNIMRGLHGSPDALEEFWNFSKDLRRQLTRIFNSSSMESLVALIRIVRMRKLEEIGPIRNLENLTQFAKVVNCPFNDQLPTSKKEFTKYARHPIAYYSQIKSDGMGWDLGDMEPLGCDADSSKAAYLTTVFIAIASFGSSAIRSILEYSEKERILLSPGTFVNILENWAMYKDLPLEWVMTTSSAVGETSLQF